VNHPEILFLLSQLRYRELHEQAKQKWLIKSELKSRPGYRSFGSKIIAWIRARLPEKSKREEPPLEQYRISNPCCTETES